MAIKPKLEPIEIWCGGNIMYGVTVPRGLRPEVSRKKIQRDKGQRIEVSFVDGRDSNVDNNVIGCYYVTTYGIYACLQEEGGFESYQRSIKLVLRFSDSKDDRARVILEGLAYNPCTGLNEYFVINKFPTIKEAHRAAYEESKRIAEGTVSRQGYIEDLIESKKKEILEDLENNIKLIERRN